MEKVIENSIKYVKQNYPEVYIKEFKNSIEFEGRFIFEARKDNFEIHVAPLLRIVMTNDYPVSQPICYDVEGCIFYDHVNSDNSLCLSTEIDIAIKLKNSTSISDYINELVIPYFLSFEFWKKYKIDIFGDYSHGGKGIIESIKDYLNSSCITNEDCFYLLIWASKVKKFRKGIPREKQSYFIKYYIPLMKKLRLLSIPLLRRQYHLIYHSFM